MGGMLAATFLAVFFVPMFYVMVESFFSRKPTERVFNKLSAKSSSRRLELLQPSSYTTDSLAAYSEDPKNWQDGISYA